MDDKINLRNPAALRAYLQGDIVNAQIASAPGGIEQQEAAGQTYLITHEVLPRPGTIDSWYRLNACRSQMEALGFVFGETVDDLFVQCTLPSGWSKRADEHSSFWSGILDATGAERAALFYKAAFYDRKAYLRFNCRYCQRTWYAPTPNDPEDAEPPAEEHCIVVWDAKHRHAIWQSAPYAQADYDTEDQVTREAVAWLTDHYPDHQIPFAYWDE